MYLSIDGKSKVEVRGQFQPERREAYQKREFRLAVTSGDYPDHDTLHLSVGGDPKRAEALAAELELAAHSLRIFAADAAKADQEKAAFEAWRAEQDEARAAAEQAS